MPHSKTKNSKPSKLNRYGRRGVIVNFFLIIFSLPVMLISANEINWINGWVYFGFMISYEVIYTLLLMKINPKLLNERANIIKKGTKRFDKVFAVLYLPLYFLIMIISGFDAVRYGWSIMPLWLTILGLVMAILASYVSFWAMSVNSYFECTVIIQKGQQVCKSGPYRVVRHPGYAAGIISVLAAPLILGSWWGLVPSTMLAIMIAIRTLLEDRTLQKELQGYKEYAKTTRYRLIPWIW
ncbi:MAG TPA: isoprenylcysteine carboxylmethyltransferase family protein [Methanobacterium sp.]|nr:isoprenylcysteine carboxylmethyltransferase family protein [Methanobacterium sp.]